MEYSAELVLVKTQKGNDEVGSRRNGLNPRMRQLLILIDGRRDFGTLARMIGEKECATFALSLESDGFVARVGSVISDSSAQEYELVEAGAEMRQQNAISAAPAPVAAPAPPTVVRPHLVPAPSGQRSASVPPAAAPAAPTVEFPVMRQRITRLLNELLGPFADDINVRVEKAKSLQDLRDLQPAIAGVVEAVRGKSAMIEFVHKLGKF